MVKKLIVALLVLTVVGGAAAALIDQGDAKTVEEVVVVPTPTQTAEPIQAAQAEVTPAVQAQESLNNVGEVWSGSGTILELSATGMTLQLQDGSTVFVELGPESYWSAQGVTLLAGAWVTVDGFFNGTDYHARAVTTSTGAILTVRDENGQPLWSGSADAGQNGAQGTSGQGAVQIPADQWITVEGTVTALTNNGLIVQTSDGQALTVSFGKANFWQDQAVTFAAGDAISMLGFWQGDQFTPGQVMKTATGERILLRDPNGRPLWAGPGREQNSSGSSQGNSSGGSQGNGNGGQGNGNGNSGNGRHGAGA